MGSRELRMTRVTSCQVNRCSGEVWLVGEGEVERGDGVIGADAGSDEQQRAEGARSAGSTNFA